MTNELTAENAAEYISKTKYISPIMLRYYVRQHRIKAKVVNMRWMFNTDELDKFIKKYKDQ